MTDRRQRRVCVSSMTATRVGKDMRFKPLNSLKKAAVASYDGMA